MTAMAEPALTVLLEAMILRPVGLAAIASAVVSSPAANVMLCAPAGNTAVAVVHTMRNVATVIVHVAVSVAVPDAAKRTPAGFVLAEK